MSVTARLTFLVIVSGGSSMSTVPWGESTDFDILRVGSWRSITRAATVGIACSGTTKVSPYRELKRMATSLASSRCWR